MQSLEGFNESPCVSFLLSKQAANALKNGAMNSPHMDYVGLVGLFGIPPKWLKSNPKSDFWPPKVTPMWLSQDK